VCGLGLDRQGLVLGDEQPFGVDLALDDQRDVDGDLLALADDQQVDVLDEALDRVALDLLGQREPVLALDVDRQQRVGVLEREHRVVAGKGDVDRVGAVAVQHRGDLGVPADPAGSALAELRTRLGLDLDLRHGRNSSTQRSWHFDGCSGLQWYSSGFDLRGRTTADHRVDHGAWTTFAQRLRGALPRRGNRGSLPTARRRWEIGRWVTVRA
jgi:hypothetical protein